MKERNQAVALMVFSAFSFSLMQTVVKMSASSVGILQQVFSRNLISLLMTGILIWKNHLSFLGPKKYQLPLFARSFFGFVGVIMLFYATAHARQADVAILNRTSPVWVSLLALLFLKEKVSKIQIPVIVLCLTGAFIAMRPSFDSNPLPMFLALMTSFVSGIAYTMIAFCKDAVNPLTVIFHFSCFSTVVAGFMMIPSYVTPSWRDVWMLLGIGIFGGFGQIGLTFAYQKARASEVSIYDYSGIIFSALLGFFAFGEPFTVSAAVGALLIAGGGALSYFYNRWALKNTQ